MSSAPSKPHLPVMVKSSIPREKQARSIFMYEHKLSSSFGFLLNTKTPTPVPQYCAKIPNGGRRGRQGSLRPGPLVCIITAYTLLAKAQRLPWPHSASEMCISSVSRVGVKSDWTFSFVPSQIGEQYSRYFRAAADSPSRFRAERLPRAASVPGWC